LRYKIVRTFPKEETELELQRLKELGKDYYHPRINTRIETEVESHE
jgi:hypothetical protein